LTMKKWFGKINKLSKANDFRIEKI
jgi:hypothetical protein